MIIMIITTASRSRQCLRAAWHAALTSCKPGHRFSAWQGGCGEHQDQDLFSQSTKTKTGEDICRWRQRWTADQLRRRTPWRSNRISLATLSSTSLRTLTLELGNVLPSHYFQPCSRHGVETLFQIAVWDPESTSFLLATEVRVENALNISHNLECLSLRLRTLHTFLTEAWCLTPPETLSPSSRQTSFSKKSHSQEIFLQLIDSLSYSKQNVLHWQSFPLLMPSLPDFVRYGAYKPDQVYMPDQVQPCQLPQWPSCIVSSFVSRQALLIYYQVKELVEYAGKKKSRYS